MARAQKPDFSLSAKRTSSFKSTGGVSSVDYCAAGVCAPAVVMPDTPRSEVVWRVLATHCIRQFLLHFPLPCVAVCRHISTGFYEQVDRSANGWCQCLASGAPNTEDETVKRWSSATIWPRSPQTKDTSATGDLTLCNRQHKWFNEELDGHQPEGCSEDCARNQLPGHHKGRPFNNGTQVPSLIRMRELKQTGRFKAYVVCWKMC